MAIFLKNNEEILNNVDFNIYKFTNKERPDKDQVLIISCFSEFGCEVMGAMYCIPKIIQKNPGMYYIVIGWYGRDYLYRHLVDEFWELKEEYQWLRDKSLAFHHNSKNLRKIELNIQKYGKLVNADEQSKIAVMNNCLQEKCNHIWKHTWDKNINGVLRCPSCGSLEVERCLFANIARFKKMGVLIPDPSEAKMTIAKSYLGPRPVGVVARNRKTYGRNLPVEFYSKLLDELKGMGYTPIWLGEKQTTLECPHKDVIDISRSPEAQDLEFTLALVKQMEFTIQFWTASTRLAAITGTPYLVFESPDQLYGMGQEAYRLALCTTGKKKIVLCHYLRALDDCDGTIECTKKAINEMRMGNWKDMIGLVDRPMIVQGMIKADSYRFADV